MLPGKLPMNQVTHVLATIYEQVHYGDNSRGHQEENRGETKDN
jgi:hypothetical protein